MLSIVIVAQAAAAADQVCVSECKARATTTPGVDADSFKFGCEANLSAPEDDIDEWCHDVPVGKSIVFADCKKGVDALRACARHPTLQLQSDHAKAGCVMECKKEAGTLGGVDVDSFKLGCDAPDGPEDDIDEWCHSGAVGKSWVFADCKKGVDALRACATLALQLNASLAQAKCADDCKEKAKTMRGVDVDSFKLGCDAPDGPEDDVDNWCHNGAVGKSWVFADCLKGVTALRKCKSSIAMVEAKPDDAGFDCTDQDARARCESSHRLCCWDPNGEGDAVCMPFGQQCIQVAVLV